MKDHHIPVEGHVDLVRDSASHAIINENVGAYEKAKMRAAAAQHKEMKYGIQQEK